MTKPISAQGRKDGWTPAELAVLEPYLRRVLDPGEIWELAALLPGRTTGTIQTVLSKQRRAAGIRLGIGAGGYEAAFRADTARSTRELGTAIERELSRVDGR